MTILRSVFILSFLISANTIFCQTHNSNLGAWYAYIYKYQFKESNFGIQGDFQYRNYNILGDLEQLLLRSSVFYKIEKINLNAALGYANITSSFEGEATNTVQENRIYQEFLIPWRKGRIYSSHRLRLEQRFNQNQNFRTRYRYCLNLNIPINNKELVNNTIYLNLNTEIFINGEKNISSTTTVSHFDRSRNHLGLGYYFSEKLRIQLGIMNQTTENVSKNQLIVNFFQTF